jgi:hypothetical protein
MCPQPDLSEVADMETTLSAASLSTAGILLISIVVVESGGLFLLTIARGGHAATPFQRSFYRAGHAHAGVLVTLALASQPFVDAAAMTGVAGALARTGIGAAAILMSAGFFLAAAGRDASRPNRLVAVVLVGAAVLALSATVLGLGLLGVL